MKRHWVIENHLDGGLYLIPEETPEEELEEVGNACDMCGECNLILGLFSNWNDLKKGLTDDEGWCPYSDEYLQSVFEDN